MKIDLHIHTSTGSDGNLTVDEVFIEASKRNIGLMSITDHDSINSQERAITLAAEYSIDYLSGVELNVTFEYPEGKPVSLDFLGYRYDIKNKALQDKLRTIREHREKRAKQILDKLNVEFTNENIPLFTAYDLTAIQNSVDGAFGRPHIANYLISKGIVRDKQEAFDKYLVRCDVPKYPLSLSEASALIRNAGGILVHAHPSEPHGTSLVAITGVLEEQTRIIRKYMLNYIDGIECWHSGHSAQTTAFYTEFAREHNLIITGGSDCHQKPIVMGTLEIPDWVSVQFQSQH
ncbi:PHP domain-containing protein [Chloroflexota bacterium]